MIGSRRRSIHQPRVLTLPLSDLQGYVDAISPLVDGHLLDWILVSVGIFLFPMQRSPIVRGREEITVALVASWGALRLHTAPNGY